MRVPLVARIGALILASTAFYTYVGQMVPQKMVLPPEETVLNTEMTTAEMATVGRQIFEGKGLCVTCHTLGKSGALRFPDLSGIAARAKTRIPGMSDIDYLAQSMYEPNTFIVAGFNPGMPEINKPPIGLSDQEILTVIAYLQSLGGTPTVTLKTAHRFYTPGAPTGAAPTPGTVPPGGAVPGPGSTVPAPGGAAPATGRGGR
jgi:mono/diheme cytochrome c family protein